MFPRRPAACAMILGFAVHLAASPAPAASSLTFTRGPFVQNATSNSIQVIWRTSSPAAGFVRYGLTPALGNTLTNDAPVTNHVFSLANLIPDTTYYYRAGNDDGGSALASAVEPFRTLRLEGPVSFVVVGDSAGASAEASNVAVVVRSLSPDLVVHLGDAIADGFTEARIDRDFFTLYEPHLRSTPYYLCAGNHDLETGYGVYGDTQATNFQNAYYLPTNSLDGTERFYSFDHGDVHFVCLFNPWFSSYVFTNGSLQYVWLTNDLAATTKPWRLFFLHSPIAHSGYHSDADRNYNGLWDQHEMMSLLLPVAERYGVHMVFSSHDHNFERFAPTNGLHHCVSGGGGRRLYPMKRQYPATAQFWPVYHCLRIGITNDTLTLEAYGADGVVFDGLTLHRALAPRELHPAAWNSPAVEAGPANDGDGNISGQRFDFIGPPLFSRAGQFSNLGRVYVNNDATNLYVGFEHVMMYGNHNVFLFIESPRLTGVNRMEGLGDGFLNPAGQGADGLDCLENLIFANFTPAIGCILGDEYGDGQFRSFARSNLALNIGQGVFRLDSNLTSMPGIRLQQYNRSPQTGPVSHTNGVTLEQNADFIEVAIPLWELGGVQPGETIKLAALVGGGEYDAVEQTRHLDTSVLGCSLVGSGFDLVFVEGVSVALAADPLASIHVSIARASPHEYTLTWNSVRGRRYAIDYADSPRGFAPFHADGLPLTATGTTAAFTLTPPANASGFFRVRQMP